MCSVFSFGLCGLRTMGNADKFKKPTFVVFYDVDYVKNPKGSNYWRNRYGHENDQCYFYTHIPLLDLIVYDSVIFWEWGWCMFM